MENLPIELRTAWRSVRTRDGRRFEYQFDGTCPAVRAARYEPATDFMFLLMDSEQRLYRIPVRVSAEALALARARNATDEVLLRAIESRFCRVLEEGFAPRNNCPYDELDRFFPVDVEGMKRLLGELT